MIKGWDKKKITPKQKAQELIYNQLNVLRDGYWVEEEEKTEFSPQGMTEREIELVTDQLAKLSNRIAKMLGFESVF